jgi:hypothetical protein
MKMNKECNNTSKKTKQHKSKKLKDKNIGK